MECCPCALLECITKLRNISSTKWRTHTVATRGTTRLETVLSNGVNWRGKSVVRLHPFPSIPPAKRCSTITPTTHNSYESHIAIASMNHLVSVLCCPTTVRSFAKPKPSARFDVPQPPCAARSSSFCARDVLNQQFSENDIHRKHSESSGGGGRNTFPTDDARRGCQFLLDFINRYRAVNP